ncbi:MAG: hypothetical protein HOQ32_05190 [Lysobacter sp.]|nr:hypothetical protein [Lysobacter sp.]
MAALATAFGADGGDKARHQRSGTDTNPNTNNSTNKRGQTVAHPARNAIHLMQPPLLLDRR